MSKLANSKKSLIALACLSAVTLAGCGGSSSSSTPAPTPTPTPTPTPAPTYEYEVTVTNLTSNQPLSPITILTHADDVKTFAVGEKASTALEVLAEAGDNKDVLALDGIVNKASGSDPVGPGATFTQTIETQATDINLSILSMLVNTNDAFTGLNGHNLANYAVGDSMSFRLNVYDSGTEANTETEASIPGPAAMGEGFNAARDDLNDFVTMHPGVVSQDDGLPTSVLNASHRFDNLVARVSIKRTK
ncbi:spondin domain-containing protein [Psychrobium sp. MM17-31]|uniref:spondin domain-containing protein n=1 Tax=Psychrobium sp. MM17-31 TaxID=2917758 RepID=UPI001EF68BC9|nr:spondin domain-containing protein [Psychrobium sp. MM17-31]MCG7531546.1 spondin domain-containing protein [Psychrobium sp. MM17-31]